MVEALTDQMWLTVNHLQETDGRFAGLVTDCLCKINITVGSFSVVSDQSLLFIVIDSFI